MTVTDFNLRKLLAVADSGPFRNAVIVCEDISDDTIASKLRARTPLSCAILVFTREEIEAGRLESALHCGHDAMAELRRFRR